jgi:hypothetical protein
VPRARPVRPEPPGRPGAAGQTGPAGAAVSNPVTIAPPTLGADAKPVARMTIGSGQAALTFPVLTAAQVGPARPAAGHKVAPQDFAVTKRVDQATARLMKLLAQGRSIPRITITYLAASGDGTHLRITLTGAHLGSDETQARKGKVKPAAPVEQLTLDGIKGESVQRGFKDQ